LLRAWLLVALVGGVVGITAAPAVARSATPATTQDASITDSGFDPPNVEIPTGTAVLWTNNGARAHDVTSSTGLFQSGLLSPGQQFTYFFDTAGTYAYSSATDAGMNGTITVTGAGALTDPTAQASLGAPTAPTASTAAPDAFAYTGPAESVGLALLGTAVLLFGWALIMGKGSPLGALEPWRVLALVDPRRRGFSDELLPHGRWRRDPRRSTQANLLPASATRPVSLRRARAHRSRAVRHRPRG
jgi:plastocyanin